MTMTPVWRCTATATAHSIGPGCGATGTGQGDKHMRENRGHAVEVRMVADA